MDDLKGLDWSGSSNPPKTASQPYPTLRPSPAPSGSGRSTPNIPRPSSTTNSQPSLKIGSKPGASANDSFANLLSNRSQKATNNLSLQERQRLVLEEKTRKAQEEAKALDAQFGLQNASFLGGPARQNGGFNPTMQSSIGLNPAPSPFSGSSTSRTDDDDMLAAFNSSAPVDSSSYYPPQQTSVDRSFDAAMESGPTNANIGPSTRNGLQFGDDDDPFGLNQLTSKPGPTKTTTVNNDDDILGMLGKPVDEVATLMKPKERSQSPVHEENRVESLDPRDKAVTELVDMGFPPDNAAIALAQTESGYDVQAAVGILLHQAHEDSRRKARGNVDAPQSRESSMRRDGPSRRPAQDESTPAWMRPEDDPSRSSSRNRNQQSGKDKDVAQYASDIGSSLFKSANSLWKSGQKKVQKAVADFQQEGDSNHPKWMRDAQLAESAQNRPSKSQGLPRKPARDENMTDEAMMLEARDGGPPLPARSTDQRRNQPDSIGGRSRPSAPFDQTNPFSRAPPKELTSQQFQNRQAHRLTREDLDSSSPEVYISPARRRKPQPPPPEPLESVPKPSLPTRNEPTARVAAERVSSPFASVSQKPTRPSQSPAPIRPKAPPRQIPPASSSALYTSASHRQAGSDAFKRGDYSTAHASYTSALQPLPSSHPVTIVILCNRALTNIKVGDPRAAIADADSALQVIGVTRGEDEKINLGPTEGEKAMKEFYGKALMRKAEALENMEKWGDAAKVWRDAVEAGVGGSISIQGRTRCEKAVGGGQPSQVKPKPAARPKPSALEDLARRPTINQAKSAEAVRKLREANAAAERADDEKFALTDLVDAKLVAWKGTKSDNLRALLGSLDKVLWEGSGWAKVGMQDLVMANRVKIVYMKAIAKVHPDKVPQNATTEQRMISAAVFSTLNEAWDKFKKENSL